MLHKRKETIFNKTFYLLGRGKDESGLYWLECPSWDGNWCWKFGYIELLPNITNMKQCKDVLAHYYATHFLQFWINELTETTFTRKEGWQLCELFKQFYIFQDLAAIAYNGTAGMAYADLTAEYIGKIMDLGINNNIIPKITQAALDILDPDQQKEEE